MIVNFKNLKHETKSIELGDDSTIGDARIEVGKVYDADPALIKLIYAGAVLKNDSQKVSELKIASNGFIVVVISPKPAAPKADPIPASTPQQASVAIPEPVPVTNQSPFTSNNSNGTNTGNHELPENVLRYIQRWLSHPAVGILAQANPQIIFQLLMQDPIISPHVPGTMEEFLQLISNMNLEDVEENDGDMPDYTPGANVLPEGATRVELTPQERTDLDNLIKFATEMGIDSRTTIQYFLACGKNKELAMNLIIQERFNDN